MGSPETHIAQLPHWWKRHLGVVNEMRGLIFGPISAGILLYLLTAASFPATGSPYRLPLSAKKRALLVHFLKWLLALSVLRLVNDWLNRWAENNWTWRKEKATWQWENEVAVITGGSNGIGKAVVKGLVSYGIRVAILDVEPLSEELLQNGKKDHSSHGRGPTV